MQENATQRVLVVEDDPMVRGLLKRHLEREGFEVQAAADAESALNTLPEKRYDLVLADIHLPGQSGVEMARQINLAEDHPPVVFVTGDADEKLARTALAEGAAGYLLKPFEFFELDAVVRMALGSLKKSAQQARAVVRGVDAGGRDLTAVARQQAVLRQLLDASRKPERVVLRQGRTTKRPSLFGWRLVGGAIVCVLLSWLAGHALLTNRPERPVTNMPIMMSGGGNSSTIVVPVMVETQLQPTR